MKKLLFAVLFCTNLYGMESQVTDEAVNGVPVTVSEVGQQVSITEESVGQMGIHELVAAIEKISKLTNPTDEEVEAWIAGRVEIATRVTQLAKSENPNEEDIQTIFEACKKNQSFLNICQWAEIQAISRALTEDEAKKADVLISLLLGENLPQIDSVRIIDFSSFIEGLYLSQEQKEKYLALLKAPVMEIVEEFKNDLFDNCESALKANIESWIKQNATSFHVYRDLMVNFLARYNAINSICTRASYQLMSDEKDRVLSPIDPFSLSISLGDEEVVRYNFIQLSKINELMYSFFRDNSSINSTEEQEYLFKLNQRYKFFHAIGHAVDFFTKTLSEEQFCLNLEDIAAKFFNASVLPRFINEYLFPNAVNNEYPGYDPKKIEREIIKTSIVSMFRNVSELWQILGVMLLKDPITDQNILYIN